MAEKFKGFEYPVFKSAKGYFHSTTDLQQIKSDLIQLLLTHPGERVMMPEFGVNLKRYIFEFNDENTQFEIRNEIANALRIFEPRVVITDIIISNTMDETKLHPDDNKQELDHILYIQINFRDPENIQSVQSLKLEVPLEG